jgi:ABC-type phosphate transport system substrate-binding protein
MSKILLLLLALVTPQDRVSAQQSSFVVVVNAANSVQSLKADQVSKYFLKKVGQWDGGIRVLPVELSETLAARQEFTKSVHKKPLSAVKSFWQQQVFSGRDVPPPVKSSDAAVLEYVRANPGAIGYVSSAATLGSGIKTVTISEK